VGSSGRWLKIKAGIGLNLRENYENLPAAPAAGLCLARILRFFSRAYSLDFNWSLYYLKNTGCRRGPRSHFLESIVVIAKRFFRLLPLFPHREEGQGEGGEKESFGKEYKRVIFSSASHLLRSCTSIGPVSLTSLKKDSIYVR
jgi:hypothetical protein